VLKCVAVCIAVRVAVCVAVCVAVRVLVRLQCVTLDLPRKAFVAAYRHVCCSACCSI